MKLLEGVEVVGKQCRGPCGRRLPIEQFNLRRGSRDGRQAYCIECSRSMTKKAMTRLRDLERRVEKKVQARFDDWAGQWLRSHPEKEGTP